MSAEPLRQALQLLAEHQPLEAGLAESAFLQILDGQASEAQAASLLTALRFGGENANTLFAATRAVRARMVGFDVPKACRPLLDTCGTGGDGSCSFNVSTAVAIVCAACGVSVVKHGNRSASGNSGSSEVLSALGVEVEAELPILQRCLEEARITFLYAPRFHPALRTLAPLRKQLPFRTLFNLIGPLANPAKPEYQLIGVPKPELVPLVAQTIERLGVAQEGRVAVVHGADGMDEVTLGGLTHISWLGETTSHGTELQTWSPADFGLEPVPLSQLRVSGPEESALKMRSMLAGEKSAARDVVLANAAAALLVSRKVADLKQGVDLAAQALDGGDAENLLDRWARISRGQE